MEPNLNAQLRRALFLVDAHSHVPGILYSLRAAGVAQVVCVGEPPDGGENIEGFPLPGGFVARIRVEDLTLGGKRVVFNCDERLDGGATSPAVFAAASRLLDGPVPAPPTVSDPSPINPHEASYSTPAYPDEAHRILAVYRFWAAVNYFFAYKHLMDRPWDEALPEFIPKVSAALNELEYVKTMALMGAWLQDTHSGVPVGSTVFRNWLAGEQPPVQVRFIEDKPVVTRLLENDPNGPALGDEILEVDGLPVDQRFARVARYGSFSTPWSRDRVLAVWIMAGASGTRASCLC